MTIKIETVDQIKDWFLRQKLDDDVYYAVKYESFWYEIEIIKESEKALFLKIETKFGKVQIWVPKSVILTKEEGEKEADEACFGGLRYQAALVNYAKSLNIKGVRSNNKVLTLKKKIKDYGYEIPKKEELIANFY